MFKHLSAAFFTIPLLALFLPAAAEASRLEWNQTEARIELKPDEEEARAEFVVTNKGDETVRIARVKTSCGCTSSILNQKIIKPGESTTITAIFHKGKRQGLNHNKLEVFLDDQADAVAMLHMIVQVPTLVEAQPQIVYWNPSTSRTERHIRIKLDKRYVNEITSIEYDRSTLTITAEADPDGRADRILHILPKSFETQIRETVLIHARGVDGMKAEARLHIFVQP
ncbi:MAG: hypothetical protein ABS34_02540 [Opitutaceae bacterium BACL24 MAG-120322-bin51]|jgi:hypothetical protein|nr:MAG: hypothetical protein ABS34_02540 [Opitutaceae bacterium BACL24 MAG-120322-bin51]